MKTSMKTIESIENASTLEMIEILLAICKWFYAKGIGNPFNYNRAFEFIQAEVLGYVLTKVGGGSDGINLLGKSMEGKATEFLGFGKKGKEYSHSVSYNGTSRKSTLEEQEEYCKNKIMRDQFHYWTLIDYKNGKLVKTLKIKSEDIWTLIWPKWKNSFYNPSAADPRIGCTLSTNELHTNNIKYEVITH
jgi:hypothetical protein